MLVWPRESSAEKLMAVDSILGHHEADNQDVEIQEDIRDKAEAEQQLDAKVEPYEYQPKQRA